MADADPKAARTALQALGLSPGARLLPTDNLVLTLLPREDAEGTRGTAQLSVWRRDSLGTWQSTGQLILGANGGATRP